jgi:hypothetical protein
MMENSLATDEFIGHVDDREILWECRHCGYRVTNTFYLQIAVDVLCGGCSQRHISDYRTVKESK